ncbi:MAG TPA: hypothetical protein VMY78_06915 [Solirubrobacteraceae bacterium]|nr:hypothetical protein [Solirubrobacteraceae bacterium]
MEVVAFIVIAVLLVVIAVLLVQRRGARGDAVPRTRRSPGRRGRATPPADPMAAAVATHSEAMDARDVAVEELRLRAQANRVAAATHEREAAALAGSDDEARLQAESLHEAAIQHQRTAAELEALAPYADPGDTAASNPLRTDDRFAR